MPELEAMQVLELDGSAIAATMRAVRERAPLVHCITAVVSSSLVADGLLATGARPMMTDTEAEAPVMTTVADALLINLGNLSSDGAASITPTVEVTRERAVPWVLDPAAVGLAPVRTPLARELLTMGPSVVRANASEVLALAGGAGGRGADTTATTASAAPTASEIALRYGTVVSMSGPVDLITDGTRACTVSSGTPLLPRITGTGCLLGGLTAACVAVSDAWTGAITAAAWMAVAGEHAAGHSRGVGSFQVALLDALDQIDPSDVADEVRS